jgi:NADP-dependent 3-hydroxy acid dehydrogenase YdfG
MVQLQLVEESNALIKGSFHPGLVAVFTGATSGIGEAALKEFVKNISKPRCYMVGQSKTAADRIIDECKSLNSEAELIFIQADLTLIKNVDEVCKQIKQKESTLNLLFLSAGAALLGRNSKSTAHFHQTQSEINSLNDF